MQLLIGCGSRRDKVLSLQGKERWDDLFTLDSNPSHAPNLLWDLNVLPMPFADNSIEEIHAYEVLEHIGTQGDAAAFFALFTDLWRILQPGGHLFATVPSWRSAWALGDPGHTRIIAAATLVFLSQAEYAKQVGVTPMTDYRYLWQGDFEPVYVHEDDKHLAFVLRGIKP